MSLKIDRMELADLAQPLELARAVHQQIPKGFPIDVDQIALGAGILEIREHESTSFEGALVTDADKQEGFILVKKGAIPERRRYTIGHELGHLLNPWHQGDGGRFECVSADMRTRDSGQAKSRQRMETEANLFATELLMPLQEVSRRIGKGGVNLDDAVRLAKIFAVSKVAIARRLTDVDSNAALVVSHNDRILYSVRGKEFPWITRIKDQPLPPGTISLTSKRELSDQVEVDCDTWMDEAQDAETALYEQVLVQDDGHKLTLLVLDRSASDDDDAEREARDRSASSARFR